MNRIYESMLILRVDLGEGQREEICQKITEKIENLGGKLEETCVWAKERNFCYPIKSRGAKKERCYKGCYWLINFTLDTDKLSDLKEIVRLEERILRNLILVKGGKDG